jgi:hypothetical protein
MSIFAGLWEVTIVTPIGNIPVVFDITELDGVIHGTARSDAETVDFVDAVADGNRLTWSQEVTTPMKLNLKFEVTVEGDSITGKSSSGIFPASELMGTRAS